jgi:predicted transposase YbfD/YdcC
MRMLWAVADPALNAFVGSTGTRGKPWPHLQQVCRVERHRVLLSHGQVVRTEREVTYAVTSVPPTRANAARLLRWLRGHWAIENRLHWVRDVTFDEDRCQVRTGAAPETFAACRNLATALLRRRGYTNIAAALRTHAGRPRWAVDLVLSGGRS